MLHVDQPPRRSYVEECMQGADVWQDAPVVSVSDYTKALAEPLREAISAPMHALGTDGFGRSDTRQQLRDFFEVDHRYVVLATLTLLVRKGELDAKVLPEAVKDLGIDANKPNPLQDY